MREFGKGTQLADRYSLVRRLGGDTSTEVWLAKDRLTRASVALKITSGDPQSSKRLHAEWQASIRLMHAHIVRAFEFHDETDVAFFSQQFIDGPDFGVLAGAEAENVLRPAGLLVDALAYVHGKGLVHRDIKASNLLLDSNGAPYLSDFGVACASGQPATGGSLIAQSPQSLAGQPASAADDIFALGGLIYELLSGEPPWSSENMADDISHKTPRPLRSADGSALPGAIVDLTAKMLDKDAANRPTAQEVGNTLRDAGFEKGAAAIDAEDRHQPRQSADEVIETVDSIRTTSRPAVDAPVGRNADSAGLSPKIVSAALAVLVAVLIGVIFVLPGNVPKGSDDSAEPDPVIADEASELPPVVVKNESDNREEVYVDPEVRKRVQGSGEIPTRKLEDDDDITFSENRADYSGLDGAGKARFFAESTLGEFLSALEVLESRGVELWAMREHRSARELYEKGDAAYLKKDFAYAEELYLGALTVLEPLYERIEPTFVEAYAGAGVAFDNGDRLEALRLYELAVAITPSHAGALAGYERAKNLESVLRLVGQGLDYEEDLDLDAAQSSFERALELDELWRPARDGISRVAETRTKIEFDTRMSEGFSAISAGDYRAARAAFRVAQQLIPESNEPSDGLLQVDQGLRLQDISTLENEARSLEQDEHWDAVVQTYQEILKVDKTLSFAAQGLAEARKMSALHARLDKMIADPDRLSAPSVMQKATTLVVDITTRPDIGSRLAEQRDELSRLLRRAATPLTVPLASDNTTEVFVYKIGKMGRFMQKEVKLRPGTYVVVGTRPGYRDVRLEFRVAPEIDMQPVVVQCEEPI